LRRLFALLLMVSFSFPLIAQLLSAGPETRLPACCRRDGAHGCARNKARIEASSGGQAVVGNPLSIWAASCPLYSKGETTAAVERLQPSTPDDSAVFLDTHPAAVAAQMDARYRISFNRSFQKRGPP
jgi:hypothetical protein